MVNNNGKTRNTILQELESIKGLLHQPDKTAPTDEAKAFAQPEEDLAFSQDQCASLRQAFENLNQYFPTTNDLPAAGQAAPPLLTSQYIASPVQPSLFIETESASEAAPPPLTEVCTPSAKETAAASENLATSPVKPPTGNETRLRPQGENPFLPQHIRERLKGSNPPSIFESAPPNWSAQHQRVYDQLISKVMLRLKADLEKVLREELKLLRTAELEQLLREETEDHH